VTRGTIRTFSAVTGGAAVWIAPLAAGQPELGELDLGRLHRFDTTLRELLARFPIDAEVQPTLRSERLLRIRHELAASGHLAVAVPARDGGDGCPVLVQTLMQFICGYHDIDLRDATGLGHGRLIAAHASASVRDRWLPRLLAGALAGIAVTETHGGSQVNATRTTAVPRRDGTWAVSGTKTWISRLDEAAVFCVFFKDPAGRLTFGVVNADAAGLCRRPVTPAGLSGWTWGELHLDGVRLRRRDILVRPGKGMDLLREHFVHYRPLVAATALGAAAAACDSVAAHLDTRRKAGFITSLRGNALIALGLDPTTLEQTGTLNAAGFDYQRSTADNILNAHRGYQLAFHVEQAGRIVSGTFKYYAVSIDGRHYLPIAGESVVLASRLQLGNIRPFGQDQISVPLSKKYFLGGATSIRGWGRYEVSPLSGSGLPLGGNSLFAASAELRAVLRGNLGGVLFVDSGNVWADTWGIKLGDLRYAVGPGLRYQTPIGPIRFDVGWQLNPIPGLLVNGHEQTRRWRMHFSIGQAF